MALLCKVGIPFFPFFLFYSVADELKKQMFGVSDFLKKQFSLKGLKFF